MDAPVAPELSAFAGYVMLPLQYPNGAKRIHKEAEKRRRHPAPAVELHPLGWNPCQPRYPLDLTQPVLS